MTADHPSAYIPADRRRALASGATLASRVHGAGLFADISGFTPLTEALAQELGSQRASEALTGHLNRVFHAVIEELGRYGGVVIYFSGDAITCWLDGDDGSRAVAAGFAMQRAMDREGEITTPAGMRLQLALKVAVAVGDARRFVVGDPDIQLIDVLAGSLVDHLADAERLAETGEVVLHESALATLRGRAELGSARNSPTATNPAGGPTAGTPTAGSPVTVVKRLLQTPDEAPIEPTPTDMPAELARPWLLRPVYERLVGGHGELLAELRPAYPMFVSFGGIDYDADEAASDKLDEFVRAAQRVLSGCGGNVLQLTLGDKGAYLYGVFGTPHAHENDAERACAAALDLVALQGSTAARDIQVGISYGRLRSGTYGHARRRTFVCLGDAVNLAARLMSRAPSGAIYISQPVRSAAGDGFTSTELQPLVLKGKSAPVSAYELTGRARQRERHGRRDGTPIVGRSQELAALQANLAEAVAGQGRIVGVAAEAGMGKSRLVAELVADAREQGLLVAIGECQSYGASTGYFVWRDIWRRLLDLDEHAGADEQIAQVQRAVGELDPALSARVPLLDAVLGLPIPDTELTAAFDPKLRKTSLESLLADCLRARARREPLVLVLEDCHWLDPLSRDLLDVLARAAASAAVLVVAAYRPDSAVQDATALSRVPYLQEITLSSLDDAQMSAVVAAKLVQVLGAGTDSAAALRELIVTRAQGNPFYAEELIHFVHDRQIDPADERALRSLELPESLHSLILSRIDTLAEAPRSQLKVASVVGRVFRAPMLPDVYPELGDVQGVRADLSALRRLDLVEVDREEDESYLFKHALTHEVAYESLPFALRATLHAGVGRHLEESGAVERQLDLLAHHYSHSDDQDKKRLYLGLAAEAARASYANAAAIDYYERLAPLVTDVGRVDVLLALGSVLELVGQWERARSTGSGALELAVEIGDERSLARSETALAEVAHKQTLFDEASDRLARAGAIFATLGDDAGLGRVLHLQGTLAAQRGRFTDARTSYEQSLVIRRRSGDVKMMASVLSNLGVVAEYEGDLPLARSLHGQALQLRTGLADSWAIAISESNLGMIASLEGRHDEAREHFEEAVRLNGEVGDSWTVAMSLNNLGNANRDLGLHEVARKHYADSLRAHIDHDDRWALAFLLEDVGRLAALSGEPERALELLGFADRLREEIGAPRTPGLEQEIAATIEPAAGALTVTRRDAARRRGRDFDRTQAIEAGLCIS